jgi:predicted GNAT family acetyltransferase
MDATTEAQAYIKKGQLWVHEIAHQDGKKGIASICAVTRASSTVAGITKVYTNPAYRRLGCAERLVRQVCHQCVRFLLLLHYPDD